MALIFLASLRLAPAKPRLFLLPLLDNLENDGDQPWPKCPRALILAPTRELVIQISESIKIYSRHMKIRQAIVIGGAGMRRQAESLRHGVDILVATPGRLLDLIDQRHLDLRDTGYLILDEADRMLDMGFIRDVRKTVAMMPDERQTLLFSKRLEAIPGVGPLIATALVASIPDPTIFRSGRDMSAWIGLVPKQNSTGGKEKLGNISKAGRSGIEDPSNFPDDPAWSAYLRLE